MLPLWDSVDLGVMAIKRYSAFPNFQHYWNVAIRLFSVIYRTLVWCVWGGTPLQWSSWCFLPPQPIGSDLNLCLCIHFLQWIPLHHCTFNCGSIISAYLLSYLPSPSARAGYDTRSIFKHTNKKKDIWKQSKYIIHSVFYRDWTRCKRMIIQLIILPNINFKYCNRTR